MADIVIINPRFDPSFWGMEHALPLFDKKSMMPVGALPLLAALTPAGHTLTLIDECVEPIDFERVARADIVGVTGMSVQRARMREILAELKRRGVFTAVGGAWVSVQEDYFDGLADVIFVGEAEETWPQFLAEWEQGRHAYRYEQAEKTDMTRVPTPRYDLLKTEDYLFGSVQFSRGCPFQCEFCDIIVTFGRRPRLKTGAQVIAELEAQYRRGIDLVFIVDDNLIGNKKAIKPLLRDVAEWQRTHGYPLYLVTEASLDLAEDPELLSLMVEAGMGNVFVGIESPNEASLRETKKYQNVRKGTSIVDRVHIIQNAGMEVWCGMIVGFDADDPSVFNAQREFLHQARISTAMVGMLYAIPKTPLHDRLAREGRLDPADLSEYGTNVVPLRMSRAELRDGYVRLLNELYDAEAYFDRVDDLYLNAVMPYRTAWARSLRERPLRRLLKAGRLLAECAVLFTRLMRRVPDPALRRVYRRRILRMLRRRPNLALLHYYMIKCALHYHHYTLARGMAGAGGTVVNIFGSAAAPQEAAVAALA
jgi:radical SAM superfamily enzyme YgiQ (UPF0313 family)